VKTKHSVYHKADRETTHLERFFQDSCTEQLREEYEEASFLAVPVELSTSRTFIQRVACKQRDAL
jgi:hypothetical protein